MKGCNSLFAGAKLLKMRVIAMEERCQVRFAVAVLQLRIKKRMSNIKTEVLKITHSPLSSAVWTGLEPATPCVTGRYSNQLNYHTGNSIPSCN